MRGITVSKNKSTRFTFTISEKRLNEIFKYCRNRGSTADFIRQAIDEKMRDLDLANNSPDIKKISVKIEKDNGETWISFYHTDENGVTKLTYSMNPTFFEDFLNDCKKIRRKLPKIRK